MTHPSDGDELLAKISVFRELNPSEAHQLWEIAREKTFAPGEKILVQGKSSQYLWIVLEGQCQVVRDAPRNESRDGPLLLAELEPYSLFGEMSFFSPAPHSANVVAKSRVRLLCISRADYDDLIRDHVVAAYKLAYNIVDSLAAKLRIMDERLARLESQSDGDDEQRLEWRQFRDTLFNAWNL